MTTTSVAIGIDVGGTRTKGGLVDRDGTVAARFDQATEDGAGTKGVISAAEELITRAGELGLEVVAVGVGAAGFIDADTGTVTMAPNLVYDDPAIAAAVHSRTDLPTVVDNDANATAWGERTFGSVRGAEDLALLTLGTGIGSGFIVGGRVLRGATGAAAEMGHTVVDPDGPQCGCGLRGCLEQLASGQAIARMGREAVGSAPDSGILKYSKSSEAITGEHVALAAAEYDDTATAVLRRAGQALGIGMSNVANVFDPEVIVLSGSVARAGEPYLGPARDQLVAMTAAQRRRPIRIDLSTLGKDAGLIGAAALAFDLVS